MLTFERLSNFLTLTSAWFSIRNRFDTAFSPSLGPSIFLLRDIIDKRTQATVGCYIRSRNKIWMQIFRIFDSIIHTWLTE
jgi:hypothetical protein